MAGNQDAVYIKILVDTLEKKKETLEVLTEITKEQETALNRKDFSMDYFEEAMEKKEKVIENLNQLEDGFEAFYQRLESVLQTERAAYRSEIRKAQGLIGGITDLSVRLQAMEARNKEKLAAKLTDKRQEIRNFKNSNQTAEKYYHNMANQHQAGQSYFLDQKK